MSACFDGVFKYRECMAAPTIRFYTPLCALFLWNWLEPENGLRVAITQCKVIICFLLHNCGRSSQICRQTVLVRSRNGLTIIWFLRHCLNTGDWGKFTRILGRKDLVLVHGSTFGSQAFPTQIGVTRFWVSKCSSAFSWPITARVKAEIAFEPLLLAGGPPKPLWNLRFPCRSASCASHQP